MYTKCVNRCDTFQTIHVLQLVVVQTKIINSCKRLEAVHILQLVMVEKKPLDRCNKFETVDMFQPFSPQTYFFSFASDNSISNLLDFLFELRFDWLLFGFCFMGCYTFQQGCQFLFLLLFRDQLFISFQQFCLCFLQLFLEEFEQLIFFSQLLEKLFQLLLIDEFTLSFRKATY